jgi:hypothetical protein
MLVSSDSLAHNKTLQLQIQVREAVLARGPFALVLLTLGHELVHASQLLATSKIYNTNQREFEAFK